MSRTTKYLFYKNFIDVDENEQPYVLPFLNSIMLIEPYSTPAIRSILNFLSKVKGVRVRKSIQAYNAVYLVKYADKNLVKIMTHGGLLRTVFYDVTLDWVNSNFQIESIPSKHKKYVLMDRLSFDRRLNVTFNFIKKIVDEIEKISIEDIEKSMLEDEPKEAEIVEEVGALIADEQDEVAPVVEQADDDEDSDNEPTVFIPFAQKFLNQSVDKQTKINDIINYLAKNKGVRYSLSSKAISLFYKQSLLLKIRFVGKRSIACYNVDYDSLKKKYFTKVEDKKSYQNCKTVQRLGSPRSYSYSKSLIDVLVANFELKENPKYEKIDFVQLFKDKVKLMAEGDLATMPKSHLGYKVEIAKDKHQYDFGMAHTKVVYLDDIQEKFKKGEIVSVETLEFRGLIPSAQNSKLKISKKDGTFDKKLNFIANRVTQDAAKEILNLGGKITILE